MKTIKNYTVLFFALLVLLPANILAGDYSTLNFIGFSKDGKYLAFEEYGTQDGSGFPYANIFFIDVAGNSYAAPPVRKTIGEGIVDESRIPGEEFIRARAKRAAAAKLKKFRIVPGNTGRLVVARLITDLDVGHIPEEEERQAQSIRFTDYRNSSYFENEFELSLKTSEVKSKECDYSYEPVLKFDLRLKNTRADTQKILQKDETLPSSRNCPFAYSIQNVYVYGEKIAVFLNVYTTGFEGPDMRYLVVTGNYR